MKKTVKLLSLIFAFIFILSSLFITSFAYDDIVKEHFFVVVKEEYSADAENIISGICSEYIEKAEIITNPEDAVYESYKAMLLVSVNKPYDENFSRAKVYFDGKNYVSDILDDHYIIAPAPDSIIWNDIYNNIDDENILRSSAVSRLFDTDGDGAVTANDARLTLRASVGLEELSGKRKTAADTDNNGKISAGDAREILRYSVGLYGNNNLTVEIGEDSGVIIGPLKATEGTAYFWQCEDISESFLTEEKTIRKNTDKIGVQYEHYFIFTPKKAGTFTFDIIYSNIKKTETIDRLTITINYDNE